MVSLAAFAYLRTDGELAMPRRSTSGRVQYIGYIVVHGEIVFEGWDYRARAERAGEELLLGRERVI